ncbi:hypothetical protein ENUP19_0240G0047 [Entamoeba nuttalli]
MFDLFMDQFNTFIETWMSPIIDILEQGLINIAIKNDDERFWTVSPRENVHQLLFAIPFCLVDLILCYLIFPKTSTVHKNEKKWYYNILGCLCIFFFIMQLIYKYLRGVIVSIFMPCHCVLLVQSIVLFFYPQHTPFLYYCSCLPAVALIFPDTKKNILFFEKPMYFIQHTFQFLMPIVFNVTNTRPTIRQFFGYYFFGVFLFLLLAFYVMVPFSYATGLNLSFMLYYPHSSPWKGERYRLNAMLFVHYLGWIFGFVVYYLHVLFQWFIQKVLMLSKSTQGYKKEE